MGRELGKAPALWMPYAVIPLLLFAVIVVHAVVCACSPQARPPALLRCGHYGRAQSAVHPVTHATQHLLHPPLTHAAGNVCATVLRARKVGSSQQEKIR